MECTCHSRAFENHKRPILLLESINKVRNRRSPKAAICSCCSRCCSARLVEWWLNQLQWFKHVQATFYAGHCTRNRTNWKNSNLLSTDSLAFSSERSLLHAIYSTYACAVSVTARIKTTNPDVQLPVCSFVFATVWKKCSRVNSRLRDCFCWR